MGSGAGSCFSGSNLPGTSNVLTMYVAPAVSSSESGSLSGYVMVIASFTPSSVGHVTLPSGSASDSSAFAMRV